MNRYIPATCWAIAMLVLAVLSRIGWVERDTATLLLMVMPMIAFTTIVRRGGCRLTEQGA